MRQDPKVTKDGLVKVQFYDHDVGYENMWAIPVRRNHFRIDNVPFFIYDIAVGDIVEASLKKHRLAFKKMISRSGHRTLRARSDDGTLEKTLRLSITSKLKTLGCWVEFLEPRLLAIDVPTRVSIKSVTKELNRALLSWEYGSPSKMNR